MEHSAALIQAKPLLMVVTLCSEYRLGDGALGNGRLMVMSTLVRAVKPPLLFDRGGGAPCSGSVTWSCLSAHTNRDTEYGTWEMRLWSETQLWIAAYKGMLQGLHRGTQVDLTGTPWQVYLTPEWRVALCLCACWAGFVDTLVPWRTQQPAWAFCTCVWTSGVWPLLYVWRIIPLICPIAFFSLF